VNRVCVVALWLVATTLSTAQSTARTLHFDLSKIGLVVNGEQVCDDGTPRMQDLPSKMMTEILAGGSESVPVLIGMVGDTRVAETKEPIICYWPGMTNGDIAFCLLVGLFTDEKGRTTIAGAGWNDMLGSDLNLPAWEQMHSFNRKHGKGALQDKWRRLWSKFGDQTVWDERERCFRLKGSQ